MDKKYEEYWAEGEPGGHAEADPATSAVKAAATQARDQESKEFSEAFKSYANSDESSGNMGVGGMGDEPKAPVDEKKPEPAKPKAFKEAFAEARKGGQKQFEWNGKKYTTEMAKPKAAAPAAAPAEPAKKEEPAMDADGFPTALKGKPSLASSMKGVKFSGMGATKQ